MVIKLLDIFEFGLCTYINLKKYYDGCLDSKYQDIVYNKLEKFLLKQYKKYTPQKEKYLNKNYVWTMWWQGDYTNEPIVSKCINSIDKFKPKGYELIVVSENNYHKYIDLPEFIIKKYNAGTITIQALSDIIRARLLATYGGIWLDTTVLVIDSLDYLKDFSFWSIKKAPNKYVPKGRWAFYAIGGRKEFFQKISYLLEHYWLKHNKIIDYFLPDYVVLFLYNHDSEFKDAVDSLPFNNPNCGNLVNLLDKPFDDINWQNLRKDTVLYKLSRKVDIDLLNKEGSYFDQVVLNKSEKN